MKNTKKEMIVQLDLSEFEKKGGPMTSKEAVALIKKLGYRPATLKDFLRESNSSWRTDYYFLTLRKY